MTLPVRLDLDPILRSFVEGEVLPGLDILPDRFWSAMADILASFGPTNAALLRARDLMQLQIDEWLKARRGAAISHEEQASFLRVIGYLQPEPAEFQIETTGVDPEIAQLAGPQLVTPLSNPRYALNAANARWGSLYDALYGTDVLDPVPPPGPYDPRRGNKVIGFGLAFLDQIAPLQTGGHVDVVGYRIEADALVARLRSGRETGLIDPQVLAGWRGPPSDPQGVLLRHNGLHVEIVIDRGHPIGRDDAAGVADIQLEAALSTIQDCEDSVAAVDAEEKVAVYRTWLGLMKGDLEASFLKDGEPRLRRLDPDRHFAGRGGSSLTLPGRAVLLVRNVGHHMLTDMVKLDGQPVYETVLDALITVASALHSPRGPRPNSRAGAIYVVKPKLHGPQETALAVELFDLVEDALGLARNTVKLGIMDEERRTSANLKACIHAARQRVVFINTGFLDRTGDEIHTAMELGPMARKADIKATPWLAAYEKRNVQIGLATGFPGRAQIGKGMWAAPDQMGAMLREKIGHPRTGASTAWVPSPTAATLHALHYHQVDVTEVRRQPVASVGLNTLLQPPVAAANWSPEEIQLELDNNIQGLLGYVVRWIDQGVGCSKVPDIHDIGLMEDRATLRISSQHVANWLRHGICSEAQVREIFARMAKVVDHQNRSDPAYRPMAPDIDGNIAFQTGLELVFEGRSQPNGYTEFILHRRRRALKAAAAS